MLYSGEGRGKHVNVLAGEWWLSSDSVDNWIVGFMTALAPGLAHLASDFQMVDTQYVLFRSAANMKRN